MGAQASGLGAQQGPCHARCLERRGVRDAFFPWAWGHSEAGPPISTVAKAVLDATDLHRNRLAQEERMNELLLMGVGGLFAVGLLWFFVTRWVVNVGPT